MRKLISKIILVIVLLSPLKCISQLYSEKYTFSELQSTIDSLNQVIINYDDSSELIKEIVKFDTIYTYNFNKKEVAKLREFANYNKEIINVSDDWMDSIGVNKSTLICYYKSVNGVEIMPSIMKNIFILSKSSVKGDYKWLIYEDYVVMKGCVSGYYVGIEANGVSLVLKEKYINFRFGQNKFQKNSIKIFKRKCNKSVIYFTVRKNYESIVKVKLEVKNRKIKKIFAKINNQGEILIEESFKPEKIYSRLNEILELGDVPITN